MPKVGSPAQIGAPSKYDPALTGDVAELALAGLTDSEIAKELGIDRVTLYRWKHRYPAFRNALKTGKEVCDDAVTRSLYEKARDGDTTSMIFWLKNRRPQEWRESQATGNSLSLNVSGPLAERLIEHLASQNLPSGQPSSNPPIIDAQVIDNTSDR